MRAEAREIHIDGDTVRRPRKAWTPTVHGLLHHLNAQGLPVPRPLGYDDRHEHVTLVPGTAGDQAWPHGVFPDGARSLGQLLRTVHEATRTWTPPPASAPGPRQHVGGPRRGVHRLGRVHPEEDLDHPAG